MSVRFSELYQCLAQKFMGYQLNTRAHQERRHLVTGEKRNPEVSFKDYDNLSSSYQYSVAA